MKKSLASLLLIPAFAFAQNSYETLKLNIPKNTLEPKSVRFSNDAIFLDGQKCFNYVIKHNVIIANQKIPNYFEISSLEDVVLFSGSIKKNDSGNFESSIDFLPINKLNYSNSKIIGRNALILNLSSNQVLNNNCSLNLDNLRLFYEKSNENN
ncbi:hypothetical protein C8J95_10718 [Elizabethkingia sp. YR214]|uniref:hypothetical protein n=1 Tax=Elizabethkingia sp. YR214 TaxID=2135667 RepID=UPI000D320D6E|nr:hypothetical protein [Elizabethkingia sp. YR214]PUB28444.1 hypothetical protein C8J95_10718 [Elizabethkingia sp. YR214]